MKPLNKDDFWKEFWTNVFIFMKFWFEICMLAGTIYTTLFVIFLAPMHLVFGVMKKAME